MAGQSTIARVSSANASLGLPGWLTHLERADLIRLAASVPELTYLFRHALIQEGAYQSLLRADRRLVHRAAGETLEVLRRAPAAALSWPRNWRAILKKPPMMRAPCAITPWPATRRWPALPTSRRWPPSKCFGRR